jgi:subtilisin family serine protease/subtilase family serine protease
VRPSKALIALVLVAVALTVGSSAQSISGGPFVEGEILVKFKPGAAANAKGAAHKAAGGSPVAEIQSTGVHRIKVTAKNEQAAIALYKNNPNVLYAEPNYIRSIPMPTAHGEGQVVPSDYHFGEQWALDNTGQSFYCFPWPFGGQICLYNATPDADIDAPEAWSILQGSSAITVAVIDSGVDYTHPDLAPNYIGGYDFANLDADPMDDHGHGTHVAGTIAAAMDNPTGNPAESEGVVGVAPHARFLAYKVCRADGTCDDFAIEQAIAQAVTAGAKIINMSLGQTAFSQSLDDAVQAAWNAGLVIVAGAGNDGTTELFYPAASDNVIAVGAFDEDHRRASFSNYGSWVDISAPGNAIFSSYPATSCAASTTPGDIGCYTWNSGTSMASPHVAGAAALVWSRSDVITNSQVVDILLNSADGQGVSPVRLDSWTIHGGLNLHDAVSLGLSNLPPLADAGPDQTVPDADRDGSETVNLDGSESSDRDGSIATYEWLEGGTSIATGATASVSLAVGAHTLTLKVTDDGGETATDTVIINVTPANQVSVTASAAQGTEAGPANGSFTVSRTGDTSASLTVQYSLAGTAVGGTDYVSLPGAATIDAGASSAVVVVTPIDDTAFESNETVILTLTADPAYSLGSPGAGTVTIVSDDLPPDLVVSAMSGPSTAGADTDIVVTDTTKNQGTGSSPQSNTGFYLSANNTWDAADTFLGSRQLAPLGAGVTNALATTLHVPPSTTTGSYYVLAKADWDGVVNENLETNNVRASGVVKIGPDLIVSVITAPTTAVAGSTIDVSDTTRNQGGGSAASSTTRFYWSTNTSIDAGDPVIGTRIVPVLAAGAAPSVTTTLAVPAGAASGLYYVIAQADGLGEVPETTENNNTRASAAVKVGPDLVVTAVTAPATGAAGAMISVSDTTRNQGAGSAAPSSTGFYLSENSTISADDEFIGSRAVGELAAGGTSTISTMLPIPADTLPGSYYVIGRADWNSSVVETAETNNDRISGLIRIGGDLVVSALTAPATATLSGPIAVTDSTKNQGPAPVPESVTAFYLSLNGTYEATDQLLGTRIVGALGASATNTATTSFAVPAGTVAGSYYVIAVADANDAVAESLENNNTRLASAVKIGPDLTVTALTGPTSAVAGTTISASDTTKNQGVDATPASVTSFYLSSNSTLDAGDLLLGSRAVSSLGPGLSQVGPAALAIPVSTPAGSYYIIAKSDGPDAIAEALENNNTRTKTITITAAPSS